MDYFEEREGKGERIWGATTHAIERFIEKNKFIEEGDFRTAIRTMLKMVDKATYITFDEEQHSHILYYGAWIFVTKESSIITVYPRKGSRWERLIK